MRTIEGFAGKDSEVLYREFFRVFEKGLEDKERVLFLGSSKFEIYPLTRAFFDAVQNSDSGKEPCLVVFDSIANFNEGSWLERLVREGFPAKNILLVGMRGLGIDDKNLLEAEGIRIVLMDSFLEDLQGTCDVVMEFSNNKNLFILIDLSAVDPAFAPAVFSSEPGGFSSKEFLYLCKRMALTKSLVAINLSGFDIEKDKRTNFLTSNIYSKIGELFGKNDKGVYSD